MKHKKHLRKQSGNGSANGGGNSSNGNQSDENCEEKSNDDSIAAETNELDESDEPRENGNQSWFLPLISKNLDH